MARLEDEFRHILVSGANEVEVDSLVDLSSLSLSSAKSHDNDEDEYSPEPDLGIPDGGGQILAAQENIVKRSNHSRSRSSSHHTKSIYEIELLLESAMHDLRSIAEQMIAAGYGRECVQVYSTVRKSVIDHCFRQLGVEKLSIADVQRLEWEALEPKTPAGSALPGAAFALSSPASADSASSSLKGSLAALMLPSPRQSRELLSNC